jgi:hypothetical protein
MCWTKSVEKIKTHVLFSVTFPKILALYESVEKYCRAAQTTDDDMAHAHCMNSPLYYVILSLPVLLLSFRFGWNGVLVLLGYCAASVAGWLIPDVSGQHGSLIFKIRMYNVEWHSTIESGITTLSRNVGHQYSVTWYNIPGELWANELFTS